MPPHGMDALWAHGWRHFGREFFRYSLSLTPAQTWQTIVPLRMELSEFTPSKSQRRVARRNADLRVEVAPAVVNEAREAMFFRHRERFRDNIPDSLRVFLPETEPDRAPCECRELRLWEGEKLLAVSYLDIGADAVSSVYAMFEPDAAPRSPGIFTLLEEIRFATAVGKRFLYPGYATIESSHYDYKKGFAGLYGFDWRTNGWLPLSAFTD